VLWTWFAVIKLLAAFDLANDITPLLRGLESLVHQLDEMAEMLIGAVSLLFVWMKTRELGA